MKVFFSTILSAAVTLSANTAPASEALTETARTALVEFTEAVMAGPDTLAALLAPEYQIMRVNGIGYDRNGYLKRGAGTVSIKSDFAHEDITATVSDDVMVVRYFLRIDETIDNKPVKKRAPRLTVFRMIDGQWKVVAHANFGSTQ